MASNKKHKEENNSRKQNAIQQQMKYRHTHGVQNYNE